MSGANAALAMVAGGAIAIVAFGAGTRFAAKPGAERPAEVVEPMDDLERVRELLADVVERTNERARSDVELAPVEPRGERQIPASRIDELVTRLERITSRLDALESTGDRVRPGAGPRRGWRDVELEVDRLRRPADLPELQRFLTQHGETLARGEVPLEVSLLGVREIIDRFGWPEKMEVPTNANGSYDLTYRIASETADSRGTIEIGCTQFRTFYVERID